MTKNQLVTAIARAGQTRVVERLGWVPEDAVRDWTFNSPVYLRDAEAILEAIDAAGWAVVPKEAAQALHDSAALDALTGPPATQTEPLAREP